MRKDGAEPVVGRVYDPPGDDGRARVLVDRLWPRGLSRRAARLDEWAKDVAPSSELRTWYHRDADEAIDRFAEFRRRYREELAEPARCEAVDRLRVLAGERGLILLTASRDPALSHAAVLAELLLG